MKKGIAIILAGLPVMDTAINKRKATIFIDFSNYHYYLRKHSWEIDWGKFKMFLDMMYDINKIYYYEGVLTKAAYFDIYPKNSFKSFICMKKAKKDYFKSLRDRGFIVRQKLVSRVYDSGGKRFKRKCNFDVELTIDAITTLNGYEVCVLCTGDGDFVKLIKYLKGKHKRVVAIAGEDRLSRDLKKTAPKIIYLRDIKLDIMQE